MSSLNLKNNLQRQTTLPPPKDPSNEAGPSEVPLHVIDFEDPDDDIIEISQTAFLEVYIFSFFLIFFSLNLFLPKMKFLHTQQYYN
jgi:hypothetical protein